MSQLTKALYSLSWGWGQEQLPQWGTTSDRCSSPFTEDKVYDSTMHGFKDLDRRMVLSETGSRKGGGARRPGWEGITSTLERVSE